MKKCFEKAVEGQKWPFLLNLERKRRYYCTKNIYFHEKYSTELSIDDQNSLWNTEKHK